MAVHITNLHVPKLYLFNYVSTMTFRLTRPSVRSNRHDNAEREQDNETYDARCEFFHFDSPSQLAMTASVQLTDIGPIFGEFVLVLGGSL